MTATAPASSALLALTCQKFRRWKIQSGKLTTGESVAWLGEISRPGLVYFKKEHQVCQEGQVERKASDFTPNRWLSKVPLKNKIKNFTSLTWKKQFPRFTSSTLPSKRSWNTSQPSSLPSEVAKNPSAESKVAGLNGPPTPGTWSGDSNLLEAWDVRIDGHSICGIDWVREFWRGRHGIHGKIRLQ